MLSHYTLVKIKGFFFKAAFHSFRNIEVEYGLLTLVWNAIVFAIKPKNNPWFHKRRFHGGLRSYGFQTICLIMCNASTSTDFAPTVPIVNAKRRRLCQIQLTFPYFLTLRHKNTFLSKLYFYKVLFQTSMHKPSLGIGREAVQITGKRR